MKTYRTFAICALLAAAAVMLVGCGEGGGDETGSLALEQTTAGQCNSIVATALGSAQECLRVGCTPGDDACDAVTGAFMGFFGDPDCAAAFAAAELNGLPGNASFQPAGTPVGGKHIPDIVCSGVVQCGLCPVAPSGLCETYCP
jgi:hypothetical protein